MPKFQDPRMHMRISVHEDLWKRMLMQTSNNLDPRMRMQMRISVQEDPGCEYLEYYKYHVLLINMICILLLLQNTEYVLSL